MSKDIDRNPRRVWLGLAVPGKKMMGVLESRERLTSGQTLTELYGDEGHVALYSAWLALQLLPRQGIARRVRYGAVLADIRDFLRLRFRINVVSNPMKTWSDVDEVIVHATDGELLNNVIERLDGLSHAASKESDVGMTEWLNSIRQVKELLKNAARRSYPGDPEEYVDYELRFARPRPQPLSESELEHGDVMS